jgi:LPXTG-motif cell wall-anchored protein
MTPRRIEQWTWVLIYGGLLTACLGWFARPTTGALGGWLLTAGAMAVVAGVALIWVRSRHKE